MKQPINKIKEGWFCYYNLYIRKSSPVIILAPGRVGSIALNSNLRQAGLFSMKVEGENDPRGSAQFAIKNILHENKPAKIVSVVRDPVDIMIGYFYSKAFWGHIEGSREALENNDIEKLQSIFLDNVLYSERLDKHLYWYENEFKKLTKIDVFTNNFNKENKYTIIDNLTYPTLIYRIDLDDNEKSQLLNDFTETDKINVTRSNTRKSKPLSATYDEFKKTIKLPDEILDKIYSSNYCKHFFTETEIKSKIDLLSD